MYDAISGESFPRVFDKELLEILVLIEDRRFYTHQGFDLRAIARAGYRRIFSNRLEGASTINQQLVRVVLERREIRFRRKVKEIVFSFLVDCRFSKTDILHAYVNLVRFREGNGLDSCIKGLCSDGVLRTKRERVLLVARFKYPFVDETNRGRYLRRVELIEKVILKRYSGD